MLNFSPTLPETRSSDLFFIILSSNFSTSQLIFVSRDFVHHSSSILKPDWLIWCCAEWRHLGWSGMSSYCAVVLLSPILEDVFSLEGLKSPGIARSRNSDRGQTSQLVSPISICPAGAEQMLAQLTLLLVAVMAPTELAEASLHVTSGVYSLLLPAWMSLYPLWTPAKLLVHRRIEWKLLKNITRC